MSVLPELEKRFAECETRIAELIKHLEDHADLEESLHTAGSGIKDASTELKHLVESTKVATESLTAILASFQDAVKILQQADPARATEAVARIEERLNSAEQGIKKTVLTTTVVIVLVLVVVEILRYLPTLLSG